MAVGVSALHVTGSPFQQGSAETIAHALNAAAYLPAGVTVSSVASVTLTRADGTLYAVGLSGSSSLAAGIVTQKVTALVAGSRYQLAVTVNLSNAEVMTMLLDLDCVA